MFAAAPADQSFVGSQPTEMYKTANNRETRFSIKALSQSALVPVGRVRAKLSKRGVLKRLLPSNKSVCQNSGVLANAAPKVYSELDGRLFVRGRKGLGYIGGYKPVKLLPPWHLAQHQCALREPGGVERCSQRRRVEKTSRKHHAAAAPAAAAAG